jgi:hypothetical protein
LRSELYELKFIGNLPKTILHSNACHKISPLRRQEKLSGFSWRREFGRPEIH